MLHKLFADGNSNPPLCVLAAGPVHSPGRLRSLSACGAFLETTGRPPMGAQAALVHPQVGAIPCTVAAHSCEGVALQFRLSEESSAFALAVTAHDMTVPAGPATGAGGR